MIFIYAYLVFIPVVETIMSKLIYCQNMKKHIFEFNQRKQIQLLESAEHLIQGSFFSKNLALEIYRNFTESEKVVFNNLGDDKIYNL